MKLQTTPSFVSKLTVKPLTVGLIAAGVLTGLAEHIQPGHSKNKGE